MDAAGFQPDGSLLDVRNLHVHFPQYSGFFGRRTGWYRAVDGISFRIGPGETLGLVGESGCGKTTAGRAILRLIPASSGTVRLNGVDVLAAGHHALRNLRRDMQIVFQDPGGSLNPRRRIGDTVAEPLIVHGVAKAGRALRATVAELLERCGMPSDVTDRYPHEFSGGQKQRIAIARAIALRPKLLVCDEPTSALDVSVQAQILNLMKDLQAAFGMSYLFISHDMNVMQHMCDRIAVMRGGQIVEEGTKSVVLGSPVHEYTRKLLSAVPVAEPRRRAG